MKRLRPILLILALLILWPASVGPVAWAEWNGYAPGWALDLIGPIYRPLYWVLIDGLRHGTSGFGGSGRAAPKGGTGRPPSALAIMGSYCSLVH